MKLADERVIFRLHAVRRMFERGINDTDVHHVLLTGEVVETYLDDSPYPSRLMLGWRGSRPLHVVVADNMDENTLIVITAYEPRDNWWESSFRRRV
jgi:hypothetical protein